MWVFSCVFSLAQIVKHYDKTHHSPMRKTIWGSVTCIWSMESMMIMMLPWWRVDRRSNQRGNSSRILEGSIERPEIDQKCWSSYKDDWEREIVQRKVLFLVNYAWIVSMKPFYVTFLLPVRYYSHISTKIPVKSMMSIIIRVGRVLCLHRKSSGTYSKQFDLWLAQIAWYW